MSTPSATEIRSGSRQSNPFLFPLCLTALGLLARLAWAHSLFLNADEALHYLLSTQPSLALTYKATLTTAHPPLLILLLHYWSWVGTSEFVLRLPSVLAGNAFCWMMFLWLGKVADRDTALIALSLLLFSPALIYVSAEIRQYALLLFFCGCCLYFLERALQENRAEWMLLSFLALCLALSTHYSALIFAFATGVYTLFRFRPARMSVSPFTVWVVGELTALGLVAFYWKTQVIPLKHSGLTQWLADSYLRGSVFHPGEDRVLPFILKTNIRVFHYLFSQGAVGVLGLILFLLGTVLLFRNKGSEAYTHKPTQRQLGWLLLLPFVVNCAAAVAGAYPYGGTRHNCYLAVFAMPAVAIAIARWRPSHAWWKPAALVIALAICNFTVLPSGAYMRPRNQRVALMRETMDFVTQSVPKGSLIVTDFEGRLLLDYYMCHSFIPVQPPLQSFYKAGCGSYELIFQDPRRWIFRAPTFPADMQTLRRMYGFGPDKKAWLFQAGFVVDQEPELHTLLQRDYGCTQPHQFGENIFVCEIQLDPTN